MSLQTVDQRVVETSADIRRYLDNALANSTRKAYKSDLKHFQAWGGTIPCNGDQIAAYLSFFAGSLSIATLQRRIVSLAKAHTMQGMKDPTKNELVRLTFRGIRKVHGKPQNQMAALMKDDLIVILSNIPDTVKGARDRALLMLGFCSAFRRSELVSIHIEHLEFTAQGIIVNLPRSKTDQSGIGRKIGIPKGRGRICPVAAVHSWISHIGGTTGPLFRSITKSGILSGTALSNHAVALIIKHYAEISGLDSKRYSGHSLRAGLATSAAQQGVSSWKIRQQTGHKSDAMLARYIRDGDIFTDNAAALF